MPFCKVSVKCSGGLNVSRENERIPRIHKLPERIRVVGCAAHARREFDEALTALPKEQQQTCKAAEVLCYFATLFQLEQSFAELKPEERVPSRFMRKIICRLG